MNQNNSPQHISRALLHDIENNNNIYDDILTFVVEITEQTTYTKMESTTPHHWLSTVSRNTQTKKDSGIRLATKNHHAAD